MLQHIGGARGNKDTVVPPFSNKKMDSMMKGFGKVQANAHWHGGVPICTTFSERQLLLSQQ